MHTVIYNVPLSTRSRREYVLSEECSCDDAVFLGALQ